MTMSESQVSPSLEEISKVAALAFEKALSSQDLYQLKTQYFGKTSPFSALMKEMRNLSADERPAFGAKVNEAKQALEVKYAEVEKRLKERDLLSKLSSERIDMTLPSPTQFISSEHPVSLVLGEMSEIFSKIGYSVRLGPLIEKDFYNFEALNMPKDHPARDMQDTFYIDDSHVLRTHTSPVQIHTMEHEKPPIRVIAPGSVFRCDSDVSHLPMFHQVEGLLIDDKVSMSDLKGTLAYFNREFFGQNVKTRFRPSFFPFTEPSAEVDCSCPLCQGKGCRLCGNSGWIEVGGCGLIHPHVFRSVGLEYPKWKGFAFGMGVERLAVVKYGIEDIRLFPENDIRFLEQF
jgi:phenylalanyl-tRNA synthetase alpha chain